MRAFLLTVFLLIAIGTSTQVQAGGVAVGTCLDEVVNALHLHLSAWEKVTPKSIKKAQLETKKAVSLITSSFTKMGRQKKPTTRELKTLAQKFETAILVINKRNNIIEQKLEGISSLNSNYLQAQSLVEQLFERHYSLILKYASVPELAAKP